MKLLRKYAGFADNTDGWLGRDALSLRVRAAADAAATTLATVLIVGESGSGTTQLARRVHRHSARAESPLVELDCATLDPTRGAALIERAFAQACPEKGRAGTIVLEHLGELASALQPQLLACIERGEAAGGEAPRLLATSRRPLRDEAADGTLVPELAYRFEVIVLCVPPLRARRADIGVIAPALLARAARRLGLAPARLTAAAIEALEAHPFPGNVSELANLMERAALLYEGREVDAAALLGAPGAASAGGDGLFVAHTLDLRALEEAAIRHALGLARGNRVRASAVLGISVRTLRNKIRRYGLGEVGRGAGRPASPPAAAAPARADGPEADAAPEGRFDRLVAG